MAHSVVSLRRSMDDLDRQQSVLTATSGAFRDTVADIGEQIAAPMEGRDSERTSALRAAAQLLRNADAAGIQAVRLRVQEDLSAFGSKIKGLVAGQKDLAEVLTLLERATANLSEREQDNQKNVRQMAREMEATVNLETIDAVRARIQSHVRALIEHADRMANSFESSIKHLQQEVDGYRSRLAQAESDAYTDPLTGLANRRALETRMGTLIANGEPFTLALADLNRFKAINDVYGHLAGDEVLRIFAARLRGLLRQGDLAARWGGDEFVVILRCRMSDALVRMRQMESRLSGPYSIRRESGNPVRVEVGASIGLAERKEAETMEQLLERADRLLYQRKPS